MATRLHWRGDEFKDRIKQAMMQAVYAGALIIQRGIKAKLNQKASNRSNPNGSPSSPGEPPAKATGHLGRSIQVAPDINEPKVRIGTAAKYARIHEYGGIITPKKGKYLSVPISKQARRASAQGSGPRAMPQLQFVRSRGGNGLLVETKGKGKRQKTIVHWALKKSVLMPKRPFFFPGFRDSKDEAMDKIKTTMQRLMRSR